MAELPMRIKRMRRPDSAPAAGSRAPGLAVAWQDRGPAPLAPARTLLPEAAAIRRPSRAGRNILSGAPSALTAGPETSTIGRLSGGLFVWAMSLPDAYRIARLRLARWQAQAAPAAIPPMKGATTA